MSESFKKIKRKCFWAAVIKSAVVGLSAGLFAVGVVLLSLLLTKHPIHWAFYILIGVACAAAAGGLCYLFMRPTDIKVARKYDREYNLDEKLQTMVAFSGQEGEIVALQRETASEILAALPARKITFGAIWQYCVCVVLSVAIFFVGVFVPAAAKEDEPPEDVNPPGDVNPPEESETPFEYDLIMQSFIGGLKNDINGSSLKKAEKDAFIAVIDTLDANLINVSTKGEMQSAVISAVILIDGIVYASNTFAGFGKDIAEFDENIAYGMYESILVYNSSNTPLSEMTRVKAFEARMGDLMEIVIEERFNASLAEIKVPQDGITDEETGEERKLGEVLTAYIGNLASVLENSQTGETDGIYTALDTFMKALNSVNLKVGKYRDETLFGEIDEAYSDLGVALNAVLCEQSYNCVMDLFVRLNLSSIFDIDMKAFPELYEELQDIVGGKGDDGEEGPGEGDGEESGGNGGGGNGSYDFVYGSNDLIYDPDRADYVKFGEVLDNYHTIMQNRVITPGAVPDDLAKILETYFEILYNGFKNESVEE